MAEANSSGSGGSTRTRKWFCYKCNQQIGNVQEDYKCPQCKDTFIEEIDESNSANDGGISSQNASGFSFSTDFGGGQGGRVDLLQLLRGLSEPGGGSQSGGGGGGRRVPNSGQRHVRFAPSTQNYRRSASDGSGPQTANFSFLLDPYSMQGAGGGGADQPVENMLFSFLNDLITGLGGGQVVGGTPVVGTNLGDYVWGRDGFDAIVTQLMNQMEGTGPAPLQEDKIESLPDVTISQEHVDRKLQCSVCWDDFVLQEKVKQLECEHLYHPDCIIPWLKLHGTCPICRKDLTGEESNTETSASPSARSETADGQSISTPTTPSDSTSASHSDNTGNPNLQAPSSNRGGANNSSEMFGPAGLANILLNQILPGAIGLNRPQQNPDPNSSSNTTGSSSTHPRDRNQRRDDDGRSGNQSRGFDYMDEFD